MFSVMQAMQRVVILFVGIFSVVRATPFDLDSVDRPTPFRYTFRVEKVQFDNDASSVGSEHADGYEIGTFESGETYNFLDESELEEILKKALPCNEMEEIPEEGCMLIDEDGIHYINILTPDNIDDFERAFKNHGVRECVFDEDHDLIVQDPCYEFDDVFDAIHLYNYSLDDDDDDETETGKSNLQQLKLKGIFNQRSSVAKKAKAFLPKKIQSIKQLQDVQKKLGRRDHHPKWMKYLQTNA